MFCFWVPSYDLYVFALKAVLPVPMVTGIHRLRNMVISLKSSSFPLMGRVNCGNLISFEWNCIVESINCSLSNTTTTPPPDVLVNILILSPHSLRPVLFKLLQDEYISQVSMCNAVKRFQVICDSSSRVFCTTQFFVQQPSPFLTLNICGHFYYSFPGNPRMFSTGLKKMTLLEE